MFWQGGVWPKSLQKPLAIAGNDHPCVQEINRSRSGGLDYICRLRTFLSLNDFKLDFVALLQALIAIAGDRAVMDEHIRSIIAAKETVSLRIVEPLDDAFHTFHVLSPGSNTQSLLNISTY
jgi:hypothetical protein